MTRINTYYSYKGFIYYYVSDAKHWRIEDSRHYLSTEEVAKKIIDSYIERHPEYEIEEEKSTFIRPEAIYSNNPFNS